MDSLTDRLRDVRYTGQYGMRMEAAEKIAGDREAMKTALTALCMARKVWAGPLGWTDVQRKDFDIAIGGLRDALGITDGQSGDGK